MSKVVFGAVVQYKENGVPRYVGETGVAPEARMRDDFEHYGEVRQALSRPGGKAEVVWAAIGRGPVGEREMGLVRDAVVEDRSRRQNLVRLAGYKPYSRHGYIMGAGE